MRICDIGLAFIVVFGVSKVGICFPKNDQLFAACCFFSSLKDKYHLPITAVNWGFLRIFPNQPLIALLHFSSRSYDSVDFAKSSLPINTAEYPPRAFSDRLLCSKAPFRFVPPKSLCGLGASSGFDIMYVLCRLGGSLLWMAEPPRFGDGTHKVLEEIDKVEEGDAL